MTAFLGVLYLLVFLAAGCTCVRFLLPRKSLLTRVWLGVSLGLLLMMWLPALIAFAVDFTWTAHLLALIPLAGLTAGCFFLRDPSPVKKWDAREKQLAGTDEVLDGLDCADIPRLTVYNKCDKPNTLSFDPDILLTSAKTGYGLDSLLAKIDEILAHRVRTIEVLLPYDKLALADVFRTRGSVLAEEYRENGVYYKATVKVDDLHRFEAYLL